MANIYLKAEILNYECLDFSKSLVTESSGVQQIANFNSGSTEPCQQKLQPASITIQYLLVVLNHSLPQKFYRESSRLGKIGLC